MSSELITLGAEMFGVGENKSKVRGYQGWDEILMITLVSSQKSPTPSISAASVSVIPSSEKRVSGGTPCTFKFFLGCVYVLPPSGKKLGLH